MAASALALLVTAATAVCPATSPVDGRPAASAAPPIGIESAANEELERLYRSGVDFAEFYAHADRRRELWTRRYERGTVDPALVERARSIGGRWRILAIAEAACSDSVNTIPFLALLVEAVPSLEMRVIGSAVGRPVMETHRTPDDRPATPTILLLDEAYEEAGCWVERPSELQTWAIEARPRLGDRTFLEQKMAWYEEDAGTSTVREVVEMLEAAAAGRPICDAG